MNIEFQLLPETLEKPFTDHFPGYDEGLIKSIPGNYIYSPGGYYYNCHSFQSY